MLSTPLSFNIAPDEIVTHYILSTSEYSVQKSQVKARALEPSPLDQSTSVFRIHALQENEIWQLGHENVNIPGNQTLRGRADISITSITSVSLQIRPDEPPPRHALVFGWPEQKDAMMPIAQELAAQASLPLAPI